MFRDSQAVRHLTVNQVIAGSNPALGARSLKVLAVSEAASRDSLKVECLVRIQDGQPRFLGSRRAGKARGSEPRYALVRFQPAHPVLILRG